MTAAAAPNIHSLTEFPDEILIVVIGHLHQQVHSRDTFSNDIAAFRSTCKRIRDLCEPAFCRGFEITCLSDLERLDLLLNGNKNRSSLYRNLVIGMGQFRYHTAVVCT